MPNFPVQGRNPGPVDTPGGTTGYLPRFSDADTIVDSIVYQDPTNSRIGIGTGAASLAAKLEVHDTAGSGWSPILKNLSSTTGAFVGLQFNTHEGSGDRQRAAIRSLKGGSSTGGDLAFLTRPESGGVTEAMRIDQAGNVGIGTTSPDNKLHVVGGHIAIEAAPSQGKLKFRESGDTHTEVYRDDADFLVVRNWVEDYTNLKIWAPQESTFPTEPREATLALVRALDDETKAEFLDLYNNYYSSQKQYGIRIQKRNPQGESVAQYRDFVFDQYDGNTDGPNNSRIYWPILSLKADRTLHLQSHADTNSWADTACIHATAAVKTTTSGAVAIVTIPLSTSRTYQIVVRVVARETGANPDLAFLYRAALAYREGGGPTIVGSDNVMPPITSAGASGWACTFAVSGNNIEVRVQSGAAITVYWVATIEYQSVSTDS